MTKKNKGDRPQGLADLLLHKAVTPLSSTELDEVRKLESLQVGDDYSEEDVKNFIITPIVKLLGYNNETNFSASLEKTIRFRGKRRRLDYRLNVWEGNFWLIEAKKPSRKADFDYKVLAQAIEYATHPDINAALVVLCDGRKLEVFDRETDIVNPVLRLEIATLSRDIDKLRALLGPWQFWYFQRRRILRLIDQVFKDEVNPERLVEFKDLVRSRLDQKRALVFQNFKDNFRHPETTENLDEAPLAKLTEALLFLERPIPDTNALIRALVAQSVRNSFYVLHKVFPDEPRDTNYIYHAQSLAYLMALEKTQPVVGWLPAWLSPSKQGSIEVEIGIKTLLKHCLTCFEGDEARKIIILAAAAFRRWYRLLALIDETRWREAEVRHFLQRYFGDELSWDQILSSPEGYLIGRFNGLAVAATNRFVSLCQPEQRAFGSGERGFQHEVAKLRLREIWRSEIQLLSSIPDYPKLRRERALGEMSTPEAHLTSYDQLGHMTLCLMHPFPHWTEYALVNHKAEVERLAALGSFKAKELLGLDKLASYPALDESEVAKRFFFGDMEVLRALRAGYRGLL